LYKYLVLVPIPQWALEGTGQRLPYLFGPGVKARTSTNRHAQNRHTGNGAQNTAGFVRVLIYSFLPYLGARDHCNTTFTGQSRGFSGHWTHFRHVPRQRRLTGIGRTCEVMASLSEELKKYCISESKMRVKTSTFRVVPLEQRLHR
jgi:hypothetical protein